MARKMKLDPVKIAVTGLLAGVVAFIYGMLLSFLEAPLGAYFAFGTAFLAVLMWVFGSKFRKGKENWVETFTMVAGITLFYMALDLLPFNIPYLNFVAELDLFGLVKTSGIVWVAEGLVKRFL